MDAAPALPPRVSLSIQIVLRESRLEGLRRTLDALDHSAGIGLSEGLCERVEVVLGDASAAPGVRDGELVELRSELGGLHGIRLHRVGAGTGPSCVHNDLAGLSQADVLVFCEPGAVPDGRALWRMAASLQDPSVGVVEAKRLPVSHHKAHEPDTGATSWATTGFTLTRRSLFLELGGFDADSFPGACGDVDYSWRVRESGRLVVHQPAAVVFHDDRMTVEGRPRTVVDAGSSARAALVLAHKWSREDEVELLSTAYRVSDDPRVRDVVEEFLADLSAGALAEPRDPSGLVGTFEAGHHTDSVPA